jgi:hypothetical protein
LIYSLIILGWDTALAVWAGGIDVDPLVDTVGVDGSLATPEKKEWVLFVVL